MYFSSDVQRQDVIHYNTIHQKNKPYLILVREKKRTYFYTKCNTFKYLTYLKDPSLHSLIKRKSTQRHGQR